MKLRRESRAIEAIRRRFRGESDHVITRFYDSDFDLDWSTWEDPDAKNGICSICRFCKEPIDWHPVDHALDCARFGDDNAIL